jgi:hypothetical protein
MNNYVSFDRSTSSIDTILGDSNLKVVVTPSGNVNAWATYSSVWTIHVSDSSFVGKIYYITST